MSDTDGFSTIPTPPTDGTEATPETHIPPKDAAILEELMAEKLPEPQMMRIPIERIRANDWNPNQMQAPMKAALSRSLVHRGYASRILVRAVSDGMYEIIDGEHRFKYLTEQNPDLGVLECLVYPEEVSEEEAMLGTLGMNHIHGQPNAIRLARLVQLLEERGISIATIEMFTGHREAKLRTLTQMGDIDIPLPVDDDPLPPSQEEEPDEKPMKFTTMEFDFKPGENGAVSDFLTKSIAAQDIVARAPEDPSRQRALALLHLLGIAED